MSPSIPRLPLVPDPFRRIRLPEDMVAATVIGAEEDAEAGGMSYEAIERIWDAALGLYRSGVHPALQVCCAGTDASCSTARSATRAATARATDPTPNGCR